MRSFIPYILTIIAFDAVYWLTMIIPNETLYLGYGSDWLEVTMNNKLPLQREIFVYLLPCVVLLINVLEIVTTINDNFYFRLAKSAFATIITYVLAWCIFMSLDTHTWNLFYHPRGMPGFVLMFSTICFIIPELVVLEVVKRYYLKRYDKAMISKHVPNWLRLEKTAV